MAKSKMFASSLKSFLAVILTVAMLPLAVSAKPKFKVLAQTESGLSAGLALDADGNIYGANCAAGPYEDGTIFELSRKHKWAMSVLHTFDGSDGACPNGGLIFDPEGNLYGTTAQGGLYRKGEIFELTPGSASTGWSFTVLYSFCEEYGCPDGAPPNAGVVRDAQGNLYGLATGGGSNGGGVAYELSPGSGGWIYEVLHNFGPPNSGMDGYEPVDALVFDRSGNLYGTTGGGGIAGALVGSAPRAIGTAFKLGQVDGVWSEEVLFSFCSGGNAPCKDGAGPVAPVALDSRGNIYGTTAGGGGNCDGILCGTLFELARNESGWSWRLVYGFLQPERGFFPNSGVTLGKKGDLYGATALGGVGPCADGCGVVYRLRAARNGEWQYDVVHKFDGADGQVPGELTMDSNGNLFGAADYVVFEVTP